jgi:pyruvate/2-oxoglutarate/acetoin dehydrogenase E1 component
MQYDAFSYPCLDQLITHVGRYHWRTRGAMQFPLVVRMPYGGGVRAPELHDDSPEAYYVHTPGIKVAIPSTPADAKGLLAAAIRDPNPVLCFESHHLYGVTGAVPEGDYTVPIGKAAVRRPGEDLTIVTCGGMVLKADEAAARLGQKGIDAEIVDLRSLAPLDTETILASVAKTKRAMILDEGPVLGGLTAELAAMIQENLFSDLKAPVIRVGAASIPPPHSGPLVDAMVPSVERIEAEALRIVGA